MEELASVLPEPAVEAEGEFVELRRPVGGGDGSLVRATQPAFEQGDDQVNVVEFAAGRRAAGGDDVRAVLKSCGFESLLNREPVAHHHCAWLHVVPQ